MQRPNSSAWSRVIRWESPRSQSAKTPPIAARSSGASWTRPDQSSGLATLEDRAKVSRVNSSRRAVPIRAASSSDCNSIARAERKSASSASCLAFSAVSSSLVASLAAVPSLVFGVNSASLFAEASSRGLSSAITACSCNASESLSARSRARSASVRLSAFSASSISAIVTRAASSRWRGVSSAPSADRSARSRSPRRESTGEERERSARGSSGIDSKGTPPIASDHG